VVRLASQQRPDRVYKLHYVRRILKEKLNMSWRKATTLTTLEITAELKFQRKVFKKFMRLLILKKNWFIWIDECAFNSSTLSQYTWVSKDKPVRIMRPKNMDRLTLISALSSTGDTYSVLRKGTNTAVEFYNFVVLLE
jgi:hypothetical protein